MSSHRPDPCLYLNLHEWLRTSDSEPGNFLTPLKERLSPYFDAQSRAARDNANPSNEIHSTSYNSANQAKDKLERSTSDLMLGFRAQAASATSDSAQMAFQFGFQARSGSDDDPEAQNMGHSTSGPCRKCDSPAINGPSHWKDPQDLSPSIVSLPDRSYSHDAFLTGGSRGFRNSGQKAPLKSSMKLASKSVGATPAELARNSNSATRRQLEYQPLWRVQTVDFENPQPEAVRRLPALELWSNESVANSFITRENSEARGSQSHKRTDTAIKRAALLSGPIFKSTIADPALTKTDVHIVAVAPSCGLESSPHEGDIGQATPTMQIVKSSNSCYEIIWDDIPAEISERVPRKDSVASLALQTASLTTTTGLRQVNSKLSEWNWGHRSDQESFISRIAVFPDDDESHDAPGSIMDDNEDAAIRAPANSQKTSVAPSHSHSTPATARSSRPTSQDKPESAQVLGTKYFEDGSEDTVGTLVVPDPETPSRIFAAASHKTKKPLVDRRLSNIDDSEARFRGHRDSVTILRSRLLHDRGISPGLFELRDPIARRLSARNHAKSEEDIAKAKTAKWEPLVTLDPANMTSPLPTPLIGPTSSILDLKSYGLGPRSSSSSSLPRQKPRKKVRNILIDD